MQVLQDINQ